MKSYTTADAWYADQDEWLHETAVLREIVLSSGLEETVKWKHPCYMDQGRNIAIISHRKGCALVSFLKGALLQDPRGRLVPPGRERSGRYLPFTNVEQIQEDRDYLLGLLAQAIEVERAGLRVEPLPDEIAYVPELQDRLDADPAFREAFEGLTTGRRRQYNLHFEDAKRASTRVARIERNTERILLGKGLTDCLCGRSKRFPRCDGSHKELA